VGGNGGDRGLVKGARTMGPRGKVKDRKVKRGGGREEEDGTQLAEASLP
jgi:hypothetical protein